MLSWPGWGGVAGVLALVMLIGVPVGFLQWRRMRRDAIGACLWLERTENGITLYNIGSVGLILQGLWAQCCRFDLTEDYSPALMPGSHITLEGGGVSGASRLVVQYACHDDVYASHFHMMPIILPGNDRHDLDILLNPSWRTKRRIRYRGGELFPLDARGWYHRIIDSGNREVRGAYIKVAYKWLRVNYFTPIQRA